jgi:hypothetical protein
MSTDRPKEILAMCDVVDRHFIFEVGPFGEFVVEETRDKWLSSGRKVTAAHVLGYIQLLAAHILESAKRDSFLRNARESLFNGMKN